MSFIYYDSNFNCSQEIPPNLKPIVSKLLVIANVYVIHQSTESVVPVNITDNLPSEIKSHRILLHASRVGKIALLRQLKPDLHLEFDVDIANTVHPHLSCVVYYGENAMPDAKIPVGRRIRSVDDILSINL